MRSILDYFPLEIPRKAQLSTLKLIQEVIEAGCTDIVIEAPTGVGKTSLGATACFFAADMPEKMYCGSTTKRGGYYLVNQKLLQDQISNDVAKNFKNKDFGSVKSSSTYPCEEYGNCQLGQLAHMQGGAKCDHCPYKQAKSAFMEAKLSLTNYPYFLTEKLFVGDLPPRNVIVLDEAHGLAETLLKYGEVVISDKALKDMGIRSFEVPIIADKQEFAKWLDEHYVPILKDALEAVKAMSDNKNSQTLSQKLSAIQNMLQKVETCVSSLRRTPDDWAFWIDNTEDEGKVAFCKPLNAAPYMDLIKKGGVVRVYMSAYPGEKNVFCRNLGLHPDEVAWFSVKSSFPKESRPIIMSGMGSMSRRNIQATLPNMLKAIERILDKHVDQKGCIHCGTYEIGKQIVAHFAGTPTAQRLLFAEKADYRDIVMEMHKSTPAPTVLLSPSMTEGFDFAGELARFQILVKVPYASLSDRSVVAKKDKDPDWYAQMALSTTLQAVGRGNRFSGDFCVHYLLDSDFSMLFDRHKSKLPKWFTEAIVKM